MPFRLRRKESAADGLRRVAEEEIDESLALLHRMQGGSEDSVHALRKNFKRIRALVRLARDALGEKAYRQENSALRSLGRRLSPVRDAAVRVGTLAKLKKNPGGGATVPAVLTRRLSARRRNAIAKLGRGRTLAAIESDLGDLRGRIHDWPRHMDAFAGLEPGLRRVYRQGRRLRSKALDLRNDEDLHEWRKRAKDLRSHVELLEKLWPKPMTDLAGELHDLTDCLGDDHDLADVRQILSHPNGVAAGVHVSELIERIDRRRSKLQSDARKLGDRIYTERPKAFTGRVESYWDAWRSGSGA
ncbi:MAG TPA: CHAD domain-containing protein [Thermoanaerobaculia bacterium]|nr:CHAD domain-containing protein [Thermoanaerobaculia bacterium]